MLNYPTIYDEVLLDYHIAANTVTVTNKTDLLKNKNMA
jgi:hypothetical protein